MIEKTIIIEPKKMTLVCERLPKSRLHFQGGGISVYVIGAVGNRRGALNYLAMTAYIEENVRVVTMRDVTVK